MICKLSKRDLRAEAERLGAEKVSRQNIYAYEAERYKICKEAGATYEGLAYSAGAIGNTGRIDEIRMPNGETIKYIYYTE